MRLTPLQFQTLRKIFHGEALSYGEKHAAARLAHHGHVRLGGTTRDPAYVVTEAGRYEMGLSLTHKTKQAVEEEVKMMLHAHRDCLRTRGTDTTKTALDVNDGYYGEAFGIMRGLRLLGFIVLHAERTRPDAVSAQDWFRRLETEVLREENFEGSNECDHCLERYGKDGAGRRRA